MSTMTITEALSELNLIKKKIDKKKPDINGNLVRYDHVPDMFEKTGGSEKFVQSELQAIDDLRKRYVAIRSAIAKVNTHTNISIDGVSQTINEWLNWRRDQANDDLSFHKSVAATLKSQLDNYANKPAFVKDPVSGETKIVRLIANTELSKHLKRVEEIESMIEKLDGQLSLKNATVTINI